MIADYPRQPADYPGHALLKERILALAALTERASASWIEIAGFGRELYTISQRVKYKCSAWEGRFYEC
jgi:hypothetical protein